MAERGSIDNERCADCPGRTPFRPSPENLARARERFAFDPPLDPGIREYVVMLVANGVETCQSCEGGPGHAYPEPTIDFEGQTSEGLRALAIALENGMPVSELRRVWHVADGVVHGPLWSMTFRPPRPPGPLPWWWAGTRMDPDAAVGAGEAGHGD